jgi:hypothetical protein
VGTSELPSADASTWLAMPAIARSALPPAAATVSAHRVASFEQERSHLQRLFRSYEHIMKSPIFNIAINRARHDCCVCRACAAHMRARACWRSGWAGASGRDCAAPVRLLQLEHQHPELNPARRKFPEPSGNLLLIQKCFPRRQVGKYSRADGMDAIYSESQQDVAVSE